MDLAFDADERMLADQAGRFAADHAASARTNGANGDGFDRAAWREIAALGWTAIGIDEAHGGLGTRGAVSQAIVQEALGTVLLPVPYFETMGLAAPLLTAVDGGEPWLRRIAENGASATLVLQAEGCRLQSGRITGSADHVPFGAFTDLLLVPVGDQLAVIEGGITRTPYAPLDPTRPVATIGFDNVIPAALLPLDPAAAKAARARAMIALAADCIGCAQGSLNAAIDYARQRQQFGRAIGSFQAIKHMAADVLTLIEFARSGLFWAALVADERPSDIAEAAAIALSSSAEAGWRAAADNVQIHGGIGFTWDHDAHLYLKRARGGLSLLGTPADHRRALAEHVFAG